MEFTCWHATFTTPPLHRSWPFRVHHRRHLHLRSPQHLQNNVSPFLCLTLYSAFLRPIDILQLPVQKYTELQAQSLEYRHRLNQEQTDYIDNGILLGLNLYFIGDGEDEEEYEKVAEKRDRVLRITKELTYLETLWNKRTRSKL